MEVFPLSLEQQIVAYTPETVIPATYRIVGSLDPELLGQALLQVINRHDALRMQLVDRDDGPQGQVFLDQDDTDLLTFSTLESGTSFEEHQRAFFARSMDIRCERAVRAELVSLGSRDLVLLVAVHHLAADALSMGVLSQEIFSSYEALVRGEVPRLRELSTSFSEHVIAQVETGDRLTADQLEYWRSLMTQSRPPRIPTTDAGGATANASARYGQLREFSSLGPDETTVLSACARGARVPQVAAVIGAIALGIEAQLGLRDFSLACPYPGRDAPGSPHLVGCFVRPAWLRIQLDPDAALGEFLTAVFRAWREGEEWSRPPYSALRMLTELGSLGVLGEGDLDAYIGDNAVVINYLHPNGLARSRTLLALDDVSVTLEDSPPLGLESAVNRLFIIDAIAEEATLTLSSWFDSLSFEEKMVSSMFEAFREALLVMTPDKLSMRLRDVWA